MATPQTKDKAMTPPTSIDEFVASLDLPQEKAEEVTTVLNLEGLPSLLNGTKVERDVPRLADISCEIAQIVLGPNTLREKREVKDLVEESWFVCPTRGYEMSDTDCLGPRHAGKFQRALFGLRLRNKYPKSCALYHSSNPDLRFAAEDTLLIREQQASPMVS